MELLPCPDCGRHVRRSERACPFCRRSPLGWKAATIAAAVAAAALGCPRSAPKYGAPPPPPTAEAPSEDEAPPPGDAQAPDAQADEVGPEAVDPNPKETDPGDEAEVTPAPDEEFPVMRPLLRAPPEQASDR